MTGLKQVSLAMAMECLLSSVSAQSALFDRVGGLLCNALSLTWLQDADYAYLRG